MLLLFTCIIKYFSLIDVDLGRYCPQPDAYRTPNAICHDIYRVCVCDSGYYDDNGANQGGKCVASMPAILSAFFSELFHKWPSTEDFINYLISLTKMAIRAKTKTTLKQF